MIIFETFGIFAILIYAYGRYFTVLYLNFIASNIAISLFEPKPKQLPFYSFDDLADAVLSGKLKLVGINNSAQSRFTHPSEEFAKTEPTLMKFYQAELLGNVAAVSTVAEAFKMIREVRIERLFGFGCQVFYFLSYLFLSFNVVTSIQQFYVEFIIYFRALYSVT